MQVPVVIAIIAILAGMLLPALNNARMMGRDAACKNNSKQISLTLLQYGTAYDGFLPTQSTDGSHWCWSVTYLKFLGEEDPRPKYDIQYTGAAKWYPEFHDPLWSAGDSVTARRTINCYLSNTYVLSAAIAPGKDNPSSTVFSGNAKTFKIDGAKNASDMYMLMEGWKWCYFQLGGVQLNQLIPNHRDIMNISFVDGHVAPEKYTKVWSYTTGGGAASTNYQYLPWRNDNGQHL